MRMRHSSLRLQQGGRSTRQPQKQQRTLYDTLPFRVSAIPEVYDIPFSVSTIPEVYGIPFSVSTMPEVYDIPFSVITIPEVKHPIT